MSLRTFIAKFSDETRLTLQFYYMIHLKVVTVESKLETEDLGGVSAGYVAIMNTFLSRYLTN